MKRSRRQRRGIVLLVVLSLLVIFTLLATTFLIVSGSYRSAAVVTARLGAKEPDPQQLLDSVFFSLLVDTDDPRSPVRGHSWLRDLYGDDGFVGHLHTIDIRPSPISAAANTRYQLFDVTIWPQTNPPQPLLDFGTLDYFGRRYFQRTTANYYNGRVLTFVDGPAKGLSTRIVRYFLHPGTGLWTFRVLPIDPTSAALPDPGAPAVNPPQPGDRLVVNGRPFSGTGFGLNPLSTFCDGPDPGPDGEWGVALLDDDNNGSVDDYTEAGAPGSDDVILTALLPNRQNLTGSMTPMNCYLWGGADESYDAPDYQNMALGAVIPNEGTPDPNDVLVLPSFHRPAMINWWVHSFIRPALEADISGPVTPQQLMHTFLLPYGLDHVRGNGDDPVGSIGFRDRLVLLKQRIILRPLPEANPAFNGGNDLFTSAAMLSTAQSNPPGNCYVTGRWDVDNDNDGAADSIWLDIGLPIREDKDGRLFKPLVAILGQDLDGRLNINAQGSLGHLATLTPGQVLHPTNLARSPVLGVGNLLPNMAPGAGHGPADVNLGVFFGNNVYDRLMRGSGPPQILRITPGRYGLQSPWGGPPAGPDGILGTTDDLDAMPGIPGWRQLSALPLPLGQRRTNDFLAWLKHFQQPRNYFAYFLEPGPDGILGTPDDVVLDARFHRGYESPPDLWGELVVGLDHAGQPAFTQQNANRELLADNPYETNLLRANGSDPLYSIAELEYFLRFNDADINPPDRPPAPQRLTSITNIFLNPPAGPLNAPLNRRLITTHSYDLPVPNMIEPPDLAGYDPTDPASLVLKPHGITNSDFRLHNIGDILRARLIQLFGWDIPFVISKWNQTYEDRLNLAMAPLLSPDLAMNLRMDLNRPFGNGEDDNLNNVIDEHGFGLPDAVSGTPFTNLEASLTLDGIDNDGDGFTDELHETEQLWGDDRDNDLENVPDGLFDEPGEPRLAAFDHDNDGLSVGDGDAFLVRAHYARHLYILMTILKNPAIGFDFDGDGTPTPAETARVIAQWAVNVVDFRDPDSIMTPFEYDATPLSFDYGPDMLPGAAGVDDDMDGTVDDPGEYLWPGPDGVFGTADDPDDRFPWHVDGVVGARPGPDGAYGTADDYDDATDPTFPDRGLVWGCERPELLISETLVHHDRRTEDLDTAGMGDTMTDDMMMPDEDFDQRLRPRGSFFVELYNPWSAATLRKPAEFYDGTGAASGLVLDGVHATSGDPVWRLLVVDDDGVVTTPDTDPRDEPYSSARVLPDADDRVIYFAAGGPAAGTAVTVTYDSATVGPIRSLQGGRYAVIGTYRETSMVTHPVTGETIPIYYDMMGRTTAAIEGSGTGPGGLEYGSTRRIIMQPDSDDASWPNVDEGNIAVAYPGVPPADNPSVLADFGAPSGTPTVVDALPPVLVPIDGLNVTEDGYPAAGFDGTAADGEGAYTTPIDVPLDVPAYLQISGHYLHGDTADDAGGTTFTWQKVVRLQRLANPLLAWNPYPGETGHDPNLQVNPYMTVDASSLELNSFNGVTAGSNMFAGAVGDQNATADEDGFYARQRGEGSPGRNLWEREGGFALPPGVSRVDQPLIPVPHHYSHGLQQSLGYLNSNFGTRFIHDFSPAPNSTTAPSLGYVGGPLTADVTIPPPNPAQTPLITSPPGLQPFQWFTWPNRPFVSQHELMLVPHSPAYKLLEDYSEFDLTRTDNAYAPGVATPAEFGHLLNFFSSTSPTGVPGPDLFRVLEFTGVPSPFVGAETILDPAVFSIAGLGTELLQPPFNLISTYREPGKINLNTIYDRVIMNALRGNPYPSGVGPSFEELVDSRRGFGERPPDPSGGRPPMHPERIGAAVAAPASWVKTGQIVPPFFPGGPDYDPVINEVPTIFANPFRSSDQGALVPLPARWARPFVDTTLLRSNRFDQAAPGVTGSWGAWPISENNPLMTTHQGTSSPRRPTAADNLNEAKRDADWGLFSRTRFTPFDWDRLGLPPDPTYATPIYPGGRPYNAHFTNAHNDPERNPYFRYEALKRFANLTTTRSNVYAVWITVGFFEVENVQAGPLNPFGYRIGNELGWDTGEIRRHRGFYVFDRSIPVAFEPGKNHNVDRAILLRRFIE